MPLADIKSQLKGYTDRIDAMSLRERAMIFVTIMVALYFVAVNVLFGPLNVEKDRLQRLVNQQRDEARMLDIQIQGMLESGAKDPEAAKRQKMAALQETLKSIDLALVRVTTGLVSPQEMTQLVEQMLLKNRGLQVIKVESLPAAPLLDKDGNANASGTMVYKHGMRVELKGGYMDILRYLKSLEGLPWKVFWGQAVLKTEKYPDSKLDLLIYTLSTHEGWIGL
jgi:MSHA biogenesis protein MshJ